MFLKINMLGKEWELVDSEFSEIEEIPFKDIGGYFANFICRVYVARNLDPVPNLVLWIHSREDALLRSREYFVKSLKMV